MAIAIRANTTKRDDRSWIKSHWESFKHALVMEGPHEWDLHPDVLRKLGNRSKPSGTDQHL
ncbi:hypothetical protein BH11ARM1_BH11ARM1_09270 [soil metagenome]